MFNRNQKNFPQQMLEELNAQMKREHSCNIIVVTRSDPREMDPTPQDCAAQREQAPCTTREDPPEQRQEELDLREQELIQREQKLREEQAKLEEAARALEEQERRLTHLSAAADRYAAERARWEQARPREGEQSHWQEGVTLTLQQLKGAKESLLAAQEGFRALVTAVDTGNREGILALCALYREMTFSPQESLRQVADQLGAILCREFEVEPLEPAVGEPYDSALCERLNAAQAGERILCCRARGWRWRGETLLRAVVDTEDKEG